MAEFEVSIQETKTIVYKVEAEDESEARIIYEDGEIIYEKSNMFEIEDIERVD